MRSVTAVSIAASIAAAASLAWLSRRRHRRRLAFTEAHVLAAMLRSGAISSVALLEIYLERVARIDRRLNAVVVRDFARARARATAADESWQRGELWGPLHGLPITGSQGMTVAGLPEPVSCVAVMRLEASGAIIFGLTNCGGGGEVEGRLAWQCHSDAFGATRNPWGGWRRDLSPGGAAGGAPATLALALTLALTLTGPRAPGS